MRVTDIRFHPCALEARASGLRGWVGFQVDGFVFDSVEVRRTTKGDFRLSFPVRVDSNGVEHAYVRPLNRGVRREIESAILAHLSRGGWVL